MLPPQSKPLDQPRIIPDLDLSAYQSDIVNDTHRFRVLACGRRWGKTTVGIAVMLKMIRDQANKTIWWIAPTYSISTDVWRSLLIALEGQWTQKQESKYLLYLGNNNQLRVRSGANPDLLRGSGLDLAVLDEAAMMEENLWTHAIRPALSDKKGSALFLSSPRGKNWFHRMYLRGLDPAFPDWKSWNYPSADGGRIDKEEVELAESELTSNTFRQEYGAEFIDEAGDVFRNVLARATGIQHEYPPPGSRIIFGIDFGRSKDFTAIAILDANTTTLLSMDRFNKIDWNAQRGRIIALNECWKPETIWAESNSIGTVNIEELRNSGLPMRSFHTNAASKPQAINALQLAFESDLQSITIYPDPVLIGELGAYQAIPGVGGGWRYSAPPGGHDDTVIALAIALYGARHSGSAMITERGSSPPPDAPNTEGRSFLR